MEIKKRELGKTGLTVTSLCCGGAPLGNMPGDFGYKVPEKQAIETLLKAFEGSISFLDTASNYGQSESRIGKALRIRGGLPEGFVIATKVGCDEAIRASVQRSIERLGIRPLPLVYLHDPEYHPRYRQDKKGAIKEMLGSGGPAAELERLKEEGIILNIGISGGPIDMMLEFVRTGRFDAVITHNRWNLLWQVADELIETAHEIGLGVVNAAPFASGILATGSQGKGRAVYKIPSAEIIERVKKMEEACFDYGVSLAQAAIQFSLCDPRVHSTVVGVSSVGQIEENLKLCQAVIPDDLWTKLSFLAIKEGDPEA